MLYDPSKMTESWYSEISIYPEYRETRIWMTAEYEILTPQEVKKLKEYWDNK
jgi:hypothetical protein